MHLYETHLSVTDTERSQLFYTSVVGLQFAHRDLIRDIVFLWCGDGKRSMLGLWGPDTTYGRDFHKSHLAFAVSLPELLAAGEKLCRSEVTCCNFGGEKTNEPSVIGWTPSAQLYFDDPDGHLVELIALLDEMPDPDFAGSFTEWRDRARTR
jgi:lactoylglutathione lyase